MLSHLNTNQIYVIYSIIYTMIYSIIYSLIQSMIYSMIYSMISSPSTAILRTKSGMLWNSRPPRMLNPKPLWPRWSSRAKYWSCWSSSTR